ncbi:MAG TPA: phosphate propanoyltransferase [Phycisphaerae bacterium]|nr:phosphate propanoyltransferase [Phycisphaerae bacterium]
MSGVNIPMPREHLERIVRQVVRERLSRGVPAGGAGVVPYTPNLVVNVSARHMHVRPDHLRKLFGPDAELTVFRWLYQPGEFAAEQTVTVFGPRKRMIERVRILGPARDYSQIEISFTDAIALGIDAPVRPSGRIEGTPGCIVVGPAGVVELPEGVIRAERHVHMSPMDAAYYGFHDKQYVKLRVESNCSMTFDRMLCRVDGRFLLEAHVDTDEGNACDLPNARSVELVAQVSNLCQ